MSEKLDLEMAVFSKIKKKNLRKLVLCPEESGLVNCQMGGPKIRLDRKVSCTPMAGKKYGLIPFAARVLANCCQPSGELQLRRTQKGNGQYGECSK